MNESSRLLSVALALAEGSEIDWDAEEESVNHADERAILRQMKVLATIARPETKGAVTPPTDDVGPAAAGIAAKTWRHLELRDEIGQGSFGTVYRAWDPKLQCEVAVKLINPSGISSAFDLSRALRG